MRNKNIFVLETSKPSRLVKIKDNLFYTITANIPSGVYQHIYITNSEKPKAGEWSLYQNKVHKCIEDIIGDEFKKIILTTDEDLIADGVQEISDDFLEFFVKNPSCEEVEVDLVPVNEFGSEITVTGYGFEKFSYKIIIPSQEEIISEYDVEPNIMYGENVGKTIKLKSNMSKEEPKQDYNGVHFRHCYQGEYEDGCKYGEDDCPAKPLEEPKQICDNCKIEISKYGCACGGKLKQETLEEAAERLYQEEFNTPYLEEVRRKNIKDAMIKLAKWQAERMYTLEQIQNDFLGYNEKGSVKVGYFDLFLDFILGIDIYPVDSPNKSDYIHWKNSVADRKKITFVEWFEKFKKK